MSKKRRITEDLTDDTAMILTEHTLTGGPAPYLIRRLHQMVTAIYTEEMAAHRITAAQYAALTEIVETPNLDQNTTAFLAGVERSTIVGVINRLIKKGLVKRTVSKTDRRVRLLKPTPAGIRFINKVKKDIDRVSMRLLEKCPPKQRDTFCDIMRLLLRDHLYTTALQLSTDLKSTPIKRRRRKS